MVSTAAVMTAGAHIGVELLITMPMTTGGIVDGTDTVSNAGDSPAIAVNATPSAMRVTRRNA